MGPFVQLGWALFASSVAFETILVTAIAAELGTLSREKKLLARNERLSINNYWDHKQAEEAAKKAWGKSELTKKEQKKAWEEFSEDWVHVVYQASELPEAMARYVGTYFLTKPEAFLLWHDMKRAHVALQEELHNQGLDPSAGASHDESMHPAFGFLSALKDTDEAFDEMGYMELMEGIGFQEWDHAFNLSSLQAVSKTRLLDKRLGQIAEELARGNQEVN